MIRALTLMPQRRMTTVEKFDYLLSDVVPFLVSVRKMGAGRERVCFVSRDCYILYRLYQAMYPTNKAVYVYFSRAAMEKASPSFLEYVAPLAPESLWVDVFGTGRSHKAFFQKHFGGVPAQTIMWGIDAPAGESKSDVTKFYKEFPAAQLRNIEKIYTAPHPSVVDVRADGPEFAPAGDVPNLRAVLAHYESALSRFYWNARIVYTTAPPPAPNFETALDIDGTIGVSGWFDAALPRLGRTCLVTARKTPLGDRGEITIERVWDLFERGGASAMTVIYMGVSRETQMAGAAAWKVTVLERLNPGVVFIDNDPRNVEAARAAGIESLHFHPGAREEFEKRFPPN